MKKLALSAAVSAFSTVLLAGPAQAAEAETVSVIVPYGDLDLTTSAGQATLDTRIDAAVKEVCARPDGLRPLHVTAAWLACRKSAAASAAEQLGVADLATETFALR